MKTAGAVVAILFIICGAYASDVHQFPVCHAVVGTLQNKHSGSFPLYELHRIRQDLLAIPLEERTMTFEASIRHCCVRAAFLALFGSVGQHNDRITAFKNEVWQLESSQWSTEMRIDQVLLERIPFLAAMRDLCDISLLGQ